jgi:hypothetical protein
MNVPNILDQSLRSPLAIISFAVLPSQRQSLQPLPRSINHTLPHSSMTSLTSNAPRFHRPPPHLLPPGSSTPLAPCCVIVHCKLPHRWANVQSNHVIVDAGYIARHQLRCHPPLSKPVSSPILTTVLTPGRIHLPNQLLMGARGIS